MSSIGSSGVADFASTYPGTALSVNANVNDGWGNAVGGQQVILAGGIFPTPYYYLLESSDFILLEDGGQILLEIS